MLNGKLPLSVDLARKIASAIEEAAAKRETRPA
jgi:hypothetical protein